MSSGIRRAPWALGTGVRPCGAGLAMAGCLRWWGEALLSAGLAAFLCALRKSRAGLGARQQLPVVPAEGRG